MDQSDLEENEQSALLSYSPEPAELDKSMEMCKEDDEDDRNSNTSSPEMPNLERKVPIHESAKRKRGDSLCEKTKSKEESEVCDMEVSDEKDQKISSEEQEDHAPKLEVFQQLDDKSSKDHPDIDHKDSSMDSNATFKWEDDETDFQKNSKEECENENKMIPFGDESTMKTDIPHEVNVPLVSVPVLEKQNEDEIKEKAELKDSVHKGSKSPKPAGSHGIDQFEFCDEVEEITLPDLRAETEKDLKDRQKQEMAADSDKKLIKNKKKDNKMEKREKDREPRRGKMTMAERKMVLLPERLVEYNQEPVAAKQNEEKVVCDSDKVDAPEDKHSTIDDVIDSVCSRARELTTEENDAEKKRVKKKVKKKPDICVDSSENKNLKKDITPGKGGRTPKSGKGKHKRLKNIVDGESDNNSSGEFGNTTSAISNNETKDNEGVVSNCKSDSNNESSMTSPSNVHPLEHQSSTMSAMDFLSGVALYSEQAVLLNRATETDTSASSNNNKIGDSTNNTVLDNTPPTTPEHETMDSALCSLSRDASHLPSDNLIKVSTSNMHSSVNRTEEFSGRHESLAGNTSPSSNDGSVGSGNVACSESSNGEVSATPTHHHNKRRRESDESMPVKKRRKSKIKSGERKSARLVTGMIL